MGCSSAILSNFLNKFPDQPSCFPVPYITVSTHQETAFCINDGFCIQQYFGFVTIHDPRYAIVVHFTKCKRLYRRRVVLKYADRFVATDIAF